MAGPFDNPVTRYAVAFTGAAVIAAVALLYLDGITRYVVLAVAALDAAVTPQILKRVS